MNVQKDHVIHLANGRFASGSSRSELSRIVAAALNDAPRNGLVVHFHGGLVNEQRGREIAERLAPQYAEAASYPLFFVWEAGVFETVINNLDDIRQEDLFQELVKKVAEWVLKKRAASIAGKGSGSGLIDERALRREFDAWFSGQSAAPPHAVTDASASTPGQFKGAPQDEQQLAYEIEASLEADFKVAVEAVYNGLYPQGQDQPRGGGGSDASTQSQLSPAAANEMFDRSPVKTKGVLSWLKVARFVAKVTVACLKRLMRQRDHGVYPTLVEEVLRAAYGDKVGTFLWDSMKQDTADAFAGDANAGGSAFLAELGQQAQNNKQFKKITLIGHSTGAIFICHLLAAAATQLPQQKFEVIFLAPAATHTLLAKTLKNCSNNIARFRMFAMQDAVECQDSLVKILYTRSLLYFVSGLLEPDEIDMPLVGMQRYLNEGDIFDPETFPDVASVATYFQNMQHSTVWSISSSPDGQRSSAKKHGDFDNDEATLKSLTHILQSGF